MQYSISQTGSLVFNRIIEVRSANQLEQELFRLLQSPFKIKITWDNHAHTAAVAFIHHGENQIGLPIHIDLVEEEESGKS